MKSIIKDDLMSYVCNTNIIMSFEIIDSKLRFMSHIVNQVKRANRLMGFIQSSYSSLNIVSFKYLFISLVHPHLEYFVTVWHPWRFYWKHPLQWFQDVTAVIKFNPWREICINWNTEHEILLNVWRYDHGL